MDGTYNGHELPLQIIGLLKEPVVKYIKAIFQWKGKGNSSILLILLLMLVFGFYWSWFWYLITLVTVNIFNFEMNSILFNKI
jgi:hypothetical protein